ncbi:O-antigen polymerase [Flavobacterium artemisiae]|uniref:O-antigen polymerase n=1 Tax=Flavobacterium artemisiae TaxID=2126556 RepID=A0ABW4H8H3_9FLAO
MTNEAFIIHLLESYGTYIIALLISILVFITLYRRIIASIFDPLALQLLSSMFGFSVVLFLFFDNLISQFYFSSYLFTQFAFWFGFFLFKKTKLVDANFPRIRIKNELLLTESCFLVFSTFNVLLQIIAYLLVGIPLFQESRLETFSGGNGIGIISRFLSILVIGGLFTAIATYKQTKKRWIKNCVIAYGILSTLFFVLSGSRASFITFLFVLFVYKAVEGERKKGEAKKNLKLVVIIGIVVVLIMSIKSGDLVSASSDFLVRIVGSGDVYWSAYPDETIENILPANPFMAIFGDFLASYRIVGWESIPKSIGLQLFNMNYPYWDVVFGSNARHNIFGYVYFGYLGSILFSFILGFILGLFRTYGFKKMRNTGILGMFFCVLYFQIVSLETDLPYVIGQLNSVFMTFVFITPFVVIVYLTQKKHERI